MPDNCNAPCSCPGPGFCPRFGIEQQDYAWRRCRGEHGEAKGLAYRRKWGGCASRVPLKMAEAGPDRPPAPPRPTPTAVVARHTLPCIALGPLVARKGCNCRRNDIHTCLKGLGVVSQNGQCETCPEYEADE